MNGNIVPLSGGDPIPLLKDRVTIGRRPDCDVQLTFPNVSGRHCELLFDNGGWVIRDLGSANGVKVNGLRVEKKRLYPGDELTIARHHHYRIQFEAQGYGNFRDDDEDVVEEENIMARPLLEKAGLQRPPRDEAEPKYFDVSDKNSNSSGKKPRQDIQ